MPLAGPPPAAANLSTLYNWHLAPRYNALMREAVRGVRLQQLHAQQQQQQQNGTRVNGNATQHWHLLDTYTMTALRPDGHLRPPVDCLHYQLPSVVDWWHHLLMTLLEDAARRREGRQKGYIHT